MKKLLLMLSGVLLALPSLARDFTYEYQGQTITYTVLDEEAKTCETAVNSSISGALVLPANPMDEDTKFTLTAIGDFSFNGCSTLSSVKIPNSVTEIGKSAFNECSKLTSIRIPDSVTKVGKEAFWRTGVSSLSIPSSVTDIDAGAFSTSNYLNKIAYPNTMNYNGYVLVKFAYDPETCEVAEDGCVYSKDRKTLYFVPSDISSFAIPEGVTTIAKNAFSTCKFETLTIPSTIELVEADAFPTKGYLPTEFTAKRVDFTDWSKWTANAKLVNLYSNPYRNCEAFAGGVKVRPVELKEGLTEIPDYINYGLKYEGEIILPSTLKRIGAYAFYDNKEVYKVFMPEGLEEIGDYAFSGCELLEDVELPESLTAIGDGAFSLCTSLKEISIPEGVKVLGSAHDLTNSSILDSRVGIFKECSSLEKVVLLCECDYIGDKMFANCSALNKVYLPLKLKSIGDYAFYNCQKIDEITLPSSLETIGNYAFGYGNSHQAGYGLNKLLIPDSVKKIGVSAFENQGISMLSLGAGLDTIPQNAFSGNPLKMIEFSEGLEVIGQDAFGYISYSLTSSPIANISIVKLPSTVTKIEKNAFQGTKISEMIIPDGVTDLPSGCCGIPSLLTIGSGVKTMSAEAFNFNNLTTLRVKTIAPPTHDTAFNITDAQNDRLTLVVNNGRKTAFTTNARWKQIDEIIEESTTDAVIYMTGDYSLSEEIRTTTGLMPASVAKMKVIGPLTDADLRVIKENMVSLRSLDLSGVTNLTAIPDNQFKGSLLTEIVLPSTITTIGKYAFSECPLLELDKLPEAVTLIYEGAFANSPRITISKLPDSLEAIGDKCFSGCTSIRSIVAPASLSSMGAFDGFKYDKVGTFSGCTLLERVDLSKTSLNMIYQYTFYDCPLLEEVHLPASVVTIGEGTFSGTAIRDLDFAANVTSIGSSAFSNCPRLISANLPKNLKKLNSNVFSGCQRLIAVSMSGEMEEIGSTVFNNDSKLANISCAATVAPSTASDAFSNIRDRYVSLTVPGLKYREYLNAPQWGKFRSIQNRLPITIEDGVDVSGVAETDYQQLLKEEAIEDAVRASQVGPASRSVQSRAASRAMSKSRNFAAIFDGAQVMTGDEGTGTRIFINPQEGVEITAIELNGKDMLPELDADNSLLVPAKSVGSLVIRTSAGKSSIDNVTIPSIDGPTEVYNLNGIKVANNIEGLAPGLYIVRQGSTVKKVAIK